MNLSILPNAEMGDPEYQKKFGIRTVENEVVYIRVSINQIEDEFIERQSLVIGNDDLSMEDWVRARAFAWTCNLLHFNKLLQIPLVLLNEISGVSYRELIEIFSDNFDPEYPILSEIATFFKSKAEAIQRGDHEFCASKEWLGVYWPVDEYFLIQLCVEGKLEKFYIEAERKLEYFLDKKGIALPQKLLSCAIELNQKLLKLPFCKINCKVTTYHNLYEFYLGVIKGSKIPLDAGERVYEIDRVSSQWASWESWYREVVWYCSKSGEYMYPIIEAKIDSHNHILALAGHH